MPGRIIYNQPGTADVFIQAGHEGRTHGATGAVGTIGREIDWTPAVADAAARALADAGLSVIRENASLYGPYHVKLALFIHFDGSNPPCRSGASIGYDDPTDKPAADLWKEIYAQYWPFAWMPDNFTENLRQYYGYSYTITSDAELVLELGEITCTEQALWLGPRLTWLGRLIAYFVTRKLGIGTISEPPPFPVPPQPAPADANPDTPSEEAPEGPPTTEP